MNGGSSAEALLRRLACEPRPAGSDAEARARRFCREVLEVNGFSVREEPFVYSDAVGRYATPVVGIAGAATLAGAALAGGSGRPGLALGVLITAGAMTVGGAWWLERHGVLRLSVRRRTGINLVATRGAPRVWLVAHLDSKSQPVPMLVRVSGIVASACLWIAAVLVAVAQLAGAAAVPWWPWFGTVGVIAALPVIATTVGDESNGAVDNASGVATVLRAASLLAPARSVGVLLTSAEELGLAGGRAWTRSRAVAGTPASIAINVDGVDDDGALVVMHGRHRPARLVEAVRTAGRSLAAPVRTRRTLPGVLTDGVALADAGWDAVTVSRGTWRTLARIHTRWDSTAALAGTGIELAARLIAATVDEVS